MARKTRQDVYDQYKQRLDLARRWRDDEGYDSTWRRLNDLYRGRHWPSTTIANQDMIAVNLAFSTINVIATICGGITISVSRSVVLSKIS
mgnify:CR=1 FL=1